MHEGNYTCNGSKIRKVEKLGKREGGEEHWRERGEVRQAKVGMRGI